MPTENTQGITDSIPVIKGGIYGAVSFIIGYVITGFVWVLIEVEELGGNVVETVGHLYYNAQFTDIEISGGPSNLQTVNYVTGHNTTAVEAPSIVYRLIPVLVPIVCGFLLARSVGTRTTRDGARAGASLVVGTVPLALLGTSVFTIEGDVVASLPLVDSLLLVGILFPLIFGVIGGVLSTQLDSTASTDDGQP